MLEDNELTANVQKFGEMSNARQRLWSIPAAPQDTAEDIVLAITKQFRESKSNPGFRSKFWVSTRLCNGIATETFIVSYVKTKALSYVTSATHRENNSIEHRGCEVYTMTIVPKDLPRRLGSVELSTTGPLYTNTRPQNFRPNPSHLPMDRYRGGRCGVRVGGLFRCPFIAYISKGTHTHPPPPTCKTPREIKQRLEALITNMDLPTLTVAKFLRSNPVKELLALGGWTSASQMHAPLACRDVIQALIRKQRILMNPIGQGFTACYLEHLREQATPNEQYIQEMHNDGVNMRIICFTAQQAEYWAMCEGFEMDSTAQVKYLLTIPILFDSFMPICHQKSDHTQDLFKLSIVSTD
ncbi:hypothetical protein N7486_008316 [Penicillium sp. IBT 16267x]|nr:hypothetical protein N7486_008316 [Penicillium sp. IBT 16267x]